MLTVCWNGIRFRVIVLCAVVFFVSSFLFAYINKEIMNILLNTIRYIFAYETSGEGKDNE